MSAGGLRPRVTLNLRHLRVFARVAELQSVSKAADAVSLSQPAVTHAISRLEQQIGAILFERRSNGTYLRPAGEILAFRTGLMFRQIEEALTEFGVTSGRAQGLETVVQRITRTQIRVLTEVASSASFADAARKLSISPVSLHRAARELERNLGKPLFNQGQFGLVASRAARELARRLSLSMREIEWAIDEIHAAEGRLGGELRVGAMPLAGGFLLGQVLHDITTYFPGMRSYVRTADGRDLSGLLRVGEIDLIVGMNRSHVDPQEMIQEPLISSPFVLIGRRNHPLAGRTRITLDDLGSFDWVVPSFGATRRAVFERLFSQIATPPVADIEANSLSTIRSLISVSDRLTLLTRFEFEFEQGGGDLVMLPFAPITHLNSIGVTRRRQWTPTALHLKFFELIRARAAQISQCGPELARD